MPCQNVNHVLPTSTMKRDLRQMQMKYFDVILNSKVIVKHESRLQMGSQTRTIKSIA